METAYPSARYPRLLWALGNISGYQWLTQQNASVLEGKAEKVQAVKANQEAEAPANGGRVE